MKTTDKVFQEGIAAHNRGEYALALKSWEYLGNTEPKMSMIHLFKGWTLSELGRREEALDEFRRYASRHPYNAAGSRAIFTVLGFLGRFKEQLEEAFRYRDAFRKLEDPSGVLNATQLETAREWLSMIAEMESYGPNELREAEIWYKKFGAEGIRK
jgi:tetratricopeptide (TPR) repeat protein